MLLLFINVGKQFDSDTIARELRALAGLRRGYVENSKRKGRQQWLGGVALLLVAGAPVVAGAAIRASGD